MEKTSIGAEKRSVADGLLKTFCTKQFMASAFLFKEIFSFTGPLSRILQGVNIDFGKALVLLDEALANLEALSPENVICIADNDFPLVEWEQKRIVRRKKMPGEKAKDSPLKTPEAKWRKDIFRVAVDAVVQWYVG